MSKISLICKDNIAYLVLNRAEKHNALTQSMWQQIAEACDKLVQEIKPRVLIIESTSNKAFSAGADIQELQMFLNTPTKLQENNQSVKQAQQKITELPFATIAKINGLCFGGGLGIAMACDFRLATPQSCFAITPAKLGLVYSIEDTRRLINLIGYAKAKEMLYSGKKIMADVAMQWGLLSDLVEANNLDEEVDKLVTNLCAASRYSIAAVKQTIEYVVDGSAKKETSIRELFDKAFVGDDFKEGAQAFLQKRLAKFD